MIVLPMEGSAMGAVDISVVTNSERVREDLGGGLRDEDGKAVGVMRGGR